MTCGIGEEILEAGVSMAMAKKQRLLVLIKRNQSGEDWLDTHDVMQQAGVGVAPFPGSTRQDCAISPGMSQLFQSAMKACRINASNLIESIDDNAGRSRSFEDACLDWRCAKARRETGQQRSFSCPWFGENDCDTRRCEQITFGNAQVTDDELSGDVKRGHGEQAFGQR
ncbi:hypothetical protein CCR83_06025 [Rhodobacter veldkampii DSM 11550]|uniref:Uncharacterized protein n=1 Tax=Phaeovulum veldkampii DSM 11550 TaxID=1185920 RepID=A0A2T4JM89_9RHOB|nr:hypothetical protein [Phaeovulum veldkampii]MBK5946019.1 hypothetical protein [Phaeovulum veldkampii DSM 11550]PTE18998.1 hypothetical protein C5F46_02260 [Phaeovulum veldkampii DSM 11550]